ncbi:MAG: hypothetical protein GX228_00760 [Firmicutes bacterium]|jgi:hypothetical protein|nr:hypothetical protein [Bacillota bacterium]NLL87447.1 hypothetical protein [Bacillota bacterium]HKM18389.1 hypothetical protein [Limnochordia bacterium]
MRKSLALRAALLMVVIVGLAGCRIFLPGNEIDGLKFFVDGEEFTEEMLVLQSGQEATITVKPVDRYGEKVIKCIFSWLVYFEGNQGIGDIDTESGETVVFTAAEVTDEPVEGLLSVSVENYLTGYTIDAQLEVSVVPAG